MPSKKPIICLCGPPAVGKSTQAELLAKHLNLIHFSEDVEHNPLLSAWLEDPLKWNYWIQLFFHSRRVCSQYQAEQFGGVLERCLYDDFVFWELGHDAAILEIEKQLLNQYRLEIDRMYTFYRRPDKIIYLTASPNTQEERIFKRARPNELKAGLQLIQKISKKYEKFFGAKGQFKPDIIVQTDGKSIQEVFSEIKSLLQ